MNILIISAKNSPLGVDAHILVQVWCIDLRHDGEERLGHSNVAFTMQFYGHVIPKMQQQAIAVLDHQFGMGEKEAVNQHSSEEIILFTGVLMHPA